MSRKDEIRELVREEAGRPRSRKPIYLAVLIFAIAAVLVFYVLSGTSMQFANTDGSQPSGQNSAAALAAYSEPIKYSVQEIGQNLDDPLMGIPEDAKNACLDAVRDYVYAFPGIRYTNMSGFLTYQEFDGTGRVGITLEADSGGFLQPPDFYSVRTEYTGASCRISSADITKWAPDSVIDSARETAKLDSGVSQMISASRNGYASYSYMDWFDSNTAAFGGYNEIIDKAGFAKPVRGVIVFELATSDDGAFVFVDAFGGKVYVEKAEA